MDMDTKALDRQTSNKVSFISYIIPKFAADYKMGVQQAYLYLKQYGGLDFLMEHWWALHTDNDIWAVHDIYLICRNNGGMR
jgi:hypothetical protein